jgi:hypothetical protein
MNRSRIATKLRVEGSIGVAVVLEASNVHVTVAVGNGEPAVVEPPSTAELAAIADCVCCHHDGVKQLAR